MKAKTITLKLTSNQAVQVSTLIYTYISTPDDDYSLYYSDRKRYNALKKIMDKIDEKL
tara:strand:+ start:48 stop:221 length:174 start_codon:yes stop_codon:yes gene_type:complete